MGLAYDMYLIKGKAEEINEKFLTIEGMVDNIGVVIKERERRENLSLREYMESETPEDIKEHWKRGQSEAYFHIWGKDLPGTEFTFGSFSAYRLFSAPYNVIFMFLANQAGIKEYLISSYHHGSNWGECQYFKSQTPFDIQLISMLGAETEKYPLFSSRVEKETEFPVKKLHKHIKETSGIIPWTFSLELPVVDVKKSEFNIFLENDFFSSSDYNSRQ